MNTLRSSLNVASLFAIVTVGLVGFAAIAQDCAGKKLQSSETSFQNTPAQTNGGGSVRAELNQNGDATGSSVKFDASTDGEKAWKLAAIALTAVAGGSTAFLAYKAWNVRKTAPSPVAHHPELEHPELLLTGIPKEALAAMPQEREALGSETPVGVKR